MSPSGTVRLGDLLKAACPGVSGALALSAIPIQGLACDSRETQKGFLFIAIRGVKKDGREFVSEAIAKGAVAVVGDTSVGLPDSIPFILVPESRQAAARLAAAFYGSPAARMKVVGITGTNGKTTASYLLEHLLISEKKKTGVIGTINTRFSGKAYPAVETTPGPLRLQRILSEMAAAGCETAVMEVSSHALDQERVAGIDFEAALFTNLTQDHLDYHRTLEAYFNCKARLFSGLGRDKCAVLNADDEWAMKIKARASCRFLTYAVEREADFKAENIQWAMNSTRFDLVIRGDRTSLLSPLLGLHNVYNVLGSLAAAEALGLDARRAGRSLAHFKGVPGRLETVDCGQDFFVFVDFAHTPDGLKNVLSCLAPYRKRKMISVFGCGGDRDRTKRPRMAEITSRYCDFVYVTSDNPRSENPRTIADEICGGFPGDFKKYAVVLDRRKAIRQALLSARRGDIVLLAGKGHEETQVIGDRAIPFSDREEAQRVLHGH